MSRLRALAALFIALLLWQLGAVAADSPTLPGPLTVAEAGAEMLASGDLLADILASLSRVAVGYSIAAVLGVSLGVATGVAGRGGEPIRSVLELLRPIPPIAWVPLSILWFGLGDKAAWFIVFVGAFFPIYIQVALALARCPPEWLELAKSLQASSRLTLLRVRLPAAAPQIAAALRTGLGLAWTSVIAAELVGAQSGLGYRIQMHRLILETEGVMVGMACIGLLGFAMSGAASRLEKTVIPWR
ncbi:MAG: ABC transporter permease [Myxococcota bacterium]|nr:ABC transporter permease [Myxococcota bacterium]